MTDTVHFTKVNDKKPLRTPVFNKVNEEPRFKKVEDKPHFTRVSSAPSPFTPPQKVTDKKVILSMTWARSYLMKDVDDTLKDDKEFALELVKSNPYTLRYLSERLRNDREVVMQALAADIGAFRCTGEKIKDNKALVMSLMAGPRWENIYKNASVRVRSDKQVLELLFCRASNSNIEMALDKIPGHETGSFDFWQRCFEANFNVYNFIPKNMKGMFSARYEGLRSELAKFDIAEPERFSTTRIAKEIIANRKNLQWPDGRPLAVLVFARDDYNGALRNNGIHELMSRGYRVVYFEAETDTQLIDNFLSATEKQKADLFVISGHGTRKYIELKDPSYESHFLDLSDRKQLNQAKLSGRMVKGGTVLLESCSTGEGGIDQYNMANMLRMVFGIDVNISAPTSPATRKSYKFDANNRVEGVKFHAGVKTYSINTTR